MPAARSDSLDYTRLDELLALLKDKDALYSTAPLFDAVRTAEGAMALIAWVEAQLGPYLPSWEGLPAGPGSSSTAAARSYSLDDLLAAVVAADPKGGWGDALDTIQEMYGQRKDRKDEDAE